MAKSPLEQFAVYEKAPLFELAGQTISWTNHSTWMVIATFCAALLFLMGSSRKAMVPGRTQAFVELTFEFIEKLVKDTAGTKALKFVPLIFTLFLFIAFLNLFGMIPGSFTATSQVFTTGLLALGVFAIVILSGFAMHGTKFFGLFLPHGTPWWLAPLIVPLEMISFFVRPLTLTIRLCANMVAGHILLKVFAGFAVMMVGLGWFAASAVLPFMMLVAISALEVFVALLQAYVFTVLTCVYLNDALNLH